jgi:hypothetical protein
MIQKVARDDVKILFKLRPSVGNNRLMRLLHELDGPKYESITELDSMCPALWRYRKKITIENVSFKFQEYSQGRDKPERCEVLAEFLKKVCEQITREEYEGKLLCMLIVPILVIIISHVKCTFHM